MKLIFLPEDGVMNVNRVERINQWRLDYFDVSTFCTLSHPSSSPLTPYSSTPSHLLIIPLIRLYHQQEIRAVGLPALLYLYILYCEIIFFDVIFISNLIIKNNISFWLEKVYKVWKRWLGLTEKTFLPASRRIKLGPLESYTRI